MKPETAARIHALEAYAEERFRIALASPFNEDRAEEAREALAAYAFELAESDS